MNKDKTNYNKGDLYYGYQEVREDGAYQICRDTKKKGVKDIFEESDHNNPLTVAYLNLHSGISPKVFKPADGDSLKAYFEVVNMLENYQLPADHNMVDRWKNFLKDHIEEVKLDNEIAEIWSGFQQIEFTKDRFTKNLKKRLPSFESSSAEKEYIKSAKKALVTSFEIKNILSEPVKYQQTTNRWIKKALFRRLSKLGIAFAIKENKIVHFNVSSKSDPSPNKSLVHEAEHPKKGFQPITQSEIRKINREFGHSHPNIDMYSFNPEDNSNTNKVERAPDKGNMKNYKGKREKQRKPFPKGVSR